MLKKTIMALTAAIFILANFGSIFAAEGPDGNKRKGKYTYRKVYKACSAAGNVDSATPKISPADKTMVQWKDIFESKNFNEFGCLQNWASLSDGDVLDIY